MWFLTIFTYLAILVQVVFITVAIGTVKDHFEFAHFCYICAIFLAAGLYYLAELVEEYTAFTKKCIWWLNTVSCLRNRNGQRLIFLFIGYIRFFRVFVVV